MLKTTLRIVSANLLCSFSDEGLVCLKEPVEVSLWHPKIRLELVVVQFQFFYAEVLISPERVLSKPFTFF